MQDFNYSISLHISHPDMDPGLISNALKLDPSRRTTRKGEPKTTPKGTPLNGVWEFSHWSHDFGTHTDQLFVAKLRQIVATLEPYRDFLREIDQEKGDVELFVGIFVDTNSNQILPHDLFFKLADSKINLRLDIYGSKLRQTNHSKNES